MAAEPKPQKFIAGADDFGCPLKDALVSYLRSINIEVEDIGLGPYYSIGEQVGRKVAAFGTDTTFGLVSCGTGASVQIFANKTPASTLSGASPSTTPRTPAPSTMPTSSPLLACQPRRKPP